MHMGECPRRHGLCSPLRSPNQMPWKAMAKQTSKQKTEFWKACKYVEVCTKESLSSFQYLGKPNWCFQLYVEVMGEREEGGNRVYMESLHQKGLAFWKCTKLQNRGHFKKIQISKISIKSRRKKQMRKIKLLSFLKRKVPVLVPWPLSIWTILAHLCGFRRGRSFVDIQCG